MLTSVVSFCCQVSLRPHFCGIVSTCVPTGLFLKVSVRNVVISTTADSSSRFSPYVPSIFALIFFFILLAVVMMFVWLWFSISRRSEKLQKIIVEKLAEIILNNMKDQKGPLLESCSHPREQLVNRIAKCLDKIYYLRDQLLKYKNETVVEHNKINDLCSQAVSLSIVAKKLCDEVNLHCCNAMKCSNEVEGLANNRD